MNNYNTHIPVHTGLIHGIHADGHNYDILYNAVKHIKGIEGITCELGLRRGGSSVLIMQACIDNNDRRIHIAIDPYGNIEIPHPMAHHNGKEGMMRTDYNDDMMMESLPLIFNWCLNNKIKFLFFPLEDTEFFARYSDGVPIYDQYKTIVNKYSLVFFDAPPRMDGANKIMEGEFFLPRTPKGGVWVFDDVDLYQHDNVEKKLFEWGFSLLEKDHKASYIKTI